MAGVDAPAGLDEVAAHCSDRPSAGHAVHDVVVFFAGREGAVDEQAGHAIHVLQAWGRPTLI